ncbi:MAG TPA: hypothetical protein VGR43_07260 [Dehalococcoidia bacterium]|jgi:hypothetical protein|nr:hypothetical protein [Dehalococcoidia bacterium]
MGTRGPKTAAGKAAVRRNALKHGLLSSAPVVRQVESIEDWEQLVEQLIADKQPEGFLETEFVMRAAGYIWRLRRIGPYEAEKINVSVTQMPEEYGEIARFGAKVTGRPIEDSITPEKVQMQTGIRMLPDPETRNNIMRYEAHLHRLLNQTLHELEAMQARRKGEHTTLARIDVSGSPGS